MAAPASQYDHIGSKYDEYARTATLKRAESYTFFRMVRALDGRRVMDLACGFGGPTEQWDYTLESFEVMAALAEAQAKSDHWMAHADREALATMMGQAALDAVGGTAAALQGVAYIGITPIIASYAQCAAILDRIGAVPGTKGIMLIFPECLAGLQVFGERVLPLMCTAKLDPPRPPRVWL